MNLPTFLPTSQEDKRTLGEFYDTYAKMQWFNKAELFENHPLQMKRVMEVTVAYLPTLEMRDLLAWAHKYNLTFEWKVLGNN